MNWMNWVTCVTAGFAAVASGLNLYFQFHQWRKNRSPSVRVNDVMCWTHVDHEDIPQGRSLDVTVYSTGADLYGLNVKLELDCCEAGPGDYITGPVDFRFNVKGKDTHVAEPDPLKINQYAEFRLEQYEIACWTPNASGSTIDLKSISAKNAKVVVRSGTDHILLTIPATQWRESWERFRKPLRDFSEKTDDAAGL